MAREFDESELLARVDNDMGFLAETVEMLETDGRVLLNELRSKLAAGDVAGAGRAAHTLKGMISNFCAPAAHALALAAEQAGKTGDGAAAVTAVDRLGPVLDALIAELAAFVKARE